MSVQIQKKLFTSDELYEINNQSEQQYELVDGELVEVAPVADAHGGIAVNIAAEIRAFNKEKRLGVVRVETGYKLTNSLTRGPDVSFYTKDKEQLAVLQRQEGYLNFAPDLAVEIVSRGDRTGEVLEKVDEYLTAGVALIWVVYPKKELVYVFRPDEPVLILHRKNGDTLLGYDVLPGFELKLETVFEIEA